jgi:WD40 repeat protein
MSQGATSLARMVEPIEAGAHVLAAGFLGPTPVLALADGTVMLGEPKSPSRVTAHPDAGMLVATLDATRLLTGGDDGRVVATSGDGSIETVADEKGKWIDALAARNDGAVAWSAGKKVGVRDAKGERRELVAASTVRGLAFAPKGYRLACAHYGGVSMWFPNASTPPEDFAWKGSHLDVTISADGRFLVTSMQENALHGWRIGDKGNMRMSGYPAKTRSLSWSHDGHWLATSGAEACIIWPFQAKDGPMGKAPAECGTRPARVSRVAFHPHSPIVAIGYEDGWALLGRLSDGAEILVRAVSQGEDAAAITALAWDGEGKRLVFGTASGKAGVLTL